MAEDARILAPKAVLHQARNVTDVVEMSVRQQQPLDAGGRHRQRIPVAQPQFFVALEESAVDHQAFAAGFQQILGTRHRAGGAEKS